MNRVECLKGLIIFTLLLVQSALAITIPETPYVPAVSEAVRAIVQRVTSGEEPKALAELKPLADAGDESATALIAEINIIGLFGQAVNPEVGCNYAARIANARPDALHNLANCFQFGSGRPKDPVRARALYRRAAEGGFRRSLCAYGNMLIAGEGGPQDAGEGMRLCRFAAVEGDANAQTDYGGYLLTGVGGERNPTTARFMLEQAVQQKQRNAAFLLGQIYQKGDGVEASEAQARGWYVKSHEWGRPDAAHQAALSYVRSGYITKGDQTFVKAPDLEQAVRWFTVSSQTHPDPAERARAAELIENLKVLIEAARQSEAAARASGSGSGGEN